MPTVQGFNSPLGFALAPGGAASTPLGPFSGLNVGDTLVNVRHVSADLVTNADVTSNASITDADEITLNLSVPPNTTGNFVLAIWRKDD